MSCLQTCHATFNIGIILVVIKLEDCTLLLVSMACSWIHGNQLINLTMDY